MYHKIREAQQGDREEGFTLIELLVVVIIIGILAAIAIPVFLNQREKARNSAANSDIRNLVTAQEAYYTDEDNYTTNSTALADNGYTQSSEVVACALVNTDDTFELAAWHPDGTKTFTYDSATGQITNTVEAAPASCNDALTGSTQVSS